MVCDKHPVTKDVWIFAVLNEFPELAQYCLTWSHVRFGIQDILKNEGEGLAYFLSIGIPLSAMNTVVSLVAADSKWATSNGTT